MASETKFKETEIGTIPEERDISRLEEIALKVTDGSMRLRLSEES